MLHTIKVFSADGDTTVAEWEVGDVLAEQHAKGVFDEARADGWAAVQPGVSGGAEALEEFVPDVEEIFLLRPIAGG